MARQRSRFHVPDHRPVCSCGIRAELHCPSHKPKPSDYPGVCACGAAVKRHKYKPRTRARVPRAPIFAGIDGEGIGSHPHRYVMLCAADESGSRRWQIANPEGLSTVECLELILSIPNTVRLFGFSFTYDLTKMLQDIPDGILYRLFRPGTRPGHRGPRSVRWGDYRLNMVGSKFTVKRGKLHQHIWDVFKFFQSSFVVALKDWNIPVDVDAIEAMKNRRSDFGQEDWQEIERYCFLECGALAMLAHRLTDAHIGAGIHLKQWHGPGSTASVLLKGYKRREIEDDKMRHAVSCAFFGGRFENNEIGPIRSPVYGKDISSAYPFQIATLPCLECGEWRRVSREDEIWSAKTALVKCTSRARRQDWAPIPHRTVDGTICYPRETTGWVWMPEYAAASYLADMQFHEAWIYESDCECVPFPWMPALYIQRCELGKDAKGKVLKLGYNSVYGKLAQSVGKPQFQDWVYAGLITAGTRAQILDVIRRTDEGTVIAIATDGIYAHKPISMPDPPDLGTHGTGKPLGGWEDTEYPSGMFFARPGIYFALSPDEGKENLIRARGVGRKSVFENQQTILDAYESGAELAELPELRRFIGARTGIRLTPREGVKRYPSYGEWEPRPVKITFNPAPKRAPDMSIRDDITGESHPYNAIIMSPEAIELRAAMLEALEQPDGELEVPAQESLFE